MPTLSDVCASACTDSSHDALKADRDLFSLLAIGEQSDGCGGGLLLANCPRCHTTLAITIEARAVAA